MAFDISQTCGREKYPLGHSWNFCSGMARTILLVDDDDGFGLLLGFAFERSGLNATLEQVANGEEAIRYLSRLGKFSDETEYPDPSLVLLDLKMPGFNGFSLLEWKARHAEFEHTPFVVLTCSELEKDLRKASEMGACCCLVKPDEIDELTRLVQNLSAYWER
jgi:two-component system response regulator